MEKKGKQKESNRKTGVVSFTDCTFAVMVTVSSSLPNDSGAVSSHMRAAAVTCKVAAVPLMTELYFSGKDRTE